MDAHHICVGDFDIYINYEHGHKTKSLKNGYVLGFVISCMDYPNV